MIQTKDFKIPYVVESIEEDAKEIGFTMSCDYETAALLRTLASSKKSSKFLELGTGAGLSTSWILDGMDKDSTLITVELDETLHKIAKKHLDNDNRIEFVTGDGEAFIKSIHDQKFDFIFADTWPGKFFVLDDTLELLNIGGLYIIDDLLPQSNWPEGHDEKVKDLIVYLDSRNDLSIAKINWSTGLIIATKI
ncbi:class I SAM-dependent methyltransferase [Bacillus sp. V3B]|uniref:O-methyltransferase n=1 Tax=Bacillus sp. V3B TaxID=2804915 RepID=UPI00210B266B|nr:class I SAM-dependent methyltransferase [Bacillus sp. V3B]MCQ6277374.1 class I SAM-dependent methyltransferase [Bacillus sp. V3B]